MSLWNDMSTVKVFSNPSMQTFYVRTRTTRITPRHCPLLWPHPWVASVARGM